MTAVPVGWARVALGEICEFKYGKSLKAATRTQGHYDVYGSNGVVGSHDSALTEGPTIIIGRKGSFGEVALSERPCWPIDTTYFIDRTGTSADLRWLSQQLGALNLTSLNRAAAVPGLNRDDAYRQLVLLPPIGEQRRIADVLDRADELRHKRRQAIAHVDALAESIFADMFLPLDQQQMAISEVATVQGGLTINGARRRLPNKVPYLRVANVHRDLVDLTEVKHLGATAAEIERTKLARDDILLVEGHGNPEEIGRAAIWSGQLESCVHQNHLIRLRFDRSYVLPRFANAYLNSREGRRQMRRAGKTTSGLNTISIRQVASTPIPAPDLAAQLRFEFLTKDVAGRRRRLLSHAAVLDELADSVRVRAFSGRL